MTEASGGSRQSEQPVQPEQPVSKAFKVAVVDRDTGGTTDEARVDEARVDEARVDEARVDGRDRQATGARRLSRSHAGADHVESAGDREPPSGPRNWRRRAVQKKGMLALWCVAILGVVGTLGFGHAWASQNAQLAEQAQVRTVTSDFLIALTNFNAKSIDADFNRIQSYATGDFAQQSNQFFGSTIRNQLEAALASSRGQIRSQYVQAVDGSHATVFSVVDQTYVNDKMKSPAADELQIVTNLTKRGSTWKVSDVTVLTNGSGTAGSAASPAAAG